MQKETFRIAVLDMYNHAPNEGMRCIQEILEQFFNEKGICHQIEIFQVRTEEKLPDTSFDAYISSGGPGSPLIKEEPWVENYFSWIQTLATYNKTHNIQKPVFFICYSFQLACRFFGIGQISKRHATSFGIFPIEIIESNHPLLMGLPDDFPAFDNRDFQVIISSKKQLKDNTLILGIEHDDSHIERAPAIMALHFNDMMWGTQFHPEADAIGMLKYLQRDERKKQIIEMHGLKKWEIMMQRAENPVEFQHTRNRIIPNFLEFAVDQKTKGR